MLGERILYIDNEGCVEEPIGEWDDGTPRMSQHHSTWDVLVSRDRMLAECEVKRRIVEGPASDRALRLASSDQVHFDNWAYDITLTQRLLAMPYADHEDYDPAWRI